MNTNLQAIKQRFGIIGRSPLLDRALGTAVRVANTDLSVLITGESGVGKEVFSKIIHGLSARKHNKFIAINCGAIPEGTINSELFGHEKGAFTGATSERKGYFESFDGGTIFLDEIGEMPLDTQSFLLRVLESGEFIRVGASKVQKTDVRIIAATNRNLEMEVQRGSFRKDLFFRLNVMSIRMPPLREHLDDVPLLACHFAERLADEMGVPGQTLKECDLLTLAEYDWPGNVRELKNVIERCLVLNSSPSDCLRTRSGPAGENVSEDVTAEADSLAIIEKRHILRMLRIEGGNKSAAARRLGISRKTLERKVRAWGMG